MQLARQAMFIAAEDDAIGELVCCRILECRALALPTFTGLVCSLMIASKHASVQCKADTTQSVPLRPACDVAHVP